MLEDKKLKIEKIVNNTSFEECEVVYLMVLTRKYLEQLADEGKNNFSVLKFFCDWSLHPAIDKSFHAMELLKQMNNLIVDLKATTDAKLIMDEITKVISFSKLRTEFQRFFKALGVSDSLTKSEDNWGAFVSTFIQVILDSPLILSGPKNDKTKSIYEDIINNPIKKGAWLISLKLTYLNNSFFKGEKVPSLHATLCLVFLTSNTTRVVIPLSKDFLK